MASKINVPVTAWNFNRVKFGTIQTHRALLQSGWEKDGSGAMVSPAQIEHPTLRHKVTGTIIPFPMWLENQSALEWAVDGKTYALSLAEG